MYGYTATGRDDLAELTQCDREPIHIPGTIQPHGILFGISADAYRVSAVSANAGAQCGGDARALLDAALSQMVDRASFDAIAAARLAPGQSLRLARLHLAGDDARTWRATMHAQDGLILLEAEPWAADGESDALDHFDRFQNAILRLQAAGDFAATCQRLVEEVRCLTGYSRVMLYRFDADWTGEVIAEAGDGAMPSYLGLHFPSSDIPVQARALYTRNAERQIPDVGYIPVPVLQGGHTPIDLSAVGLRSVSPIHLTYLRNMGVGASMSVSLLRDGRLWGLLACHHACARVVAAERLQCCVLLSQMAVARIALLEEADLARHSVAVGALATRLLRDGAETDDARDMLSTAELLRRNGGALLAMLGASGLVLENGGARTRVGTVPADDVLDRLLGWLRESDVDVLATDHIAAHLPHCIDAEAAGVLAVRLGGAPENVMVWFRPEVGRSVTWAGAPEKLLAHSDGETRLTPRQSFAAWTEQVRGRAVPWSSADIAAANRLRDAKMDVIARRAAHIQHMNTQLLRSNEELESFAYVASHDLKEPLRQIEIFGTLLQRAFGRTGDPPDRVERWLSGISTSSRRLRDLIDDLAHYARLGSEARPFAPVDMGAMLAAVLEDFAGAIAAADATIEAAALPVVMCDAIQLRQVLQNLVGNALKYRHPDRRLVLRISAAAQPAPSGARPGEVPMMAFRFADNGIGFEDRHCAQIFKPFERLHSAEAYEGSGLGLAICHKVIDRHGGTISASSQLGAGAVFTFTLPARPLPGEAARSA